MIRDVDVTLDHLLQKELGTPLPFDLSFEIPDSNFKPVSNARSTLNCYLYDIREDRELRRAEPVTHYRSAGVFERTLAPTRVMLSYSITAWSPAQVAGGGSPTFVEHRLLSRVLRALLRHPTLPSVVLFGTLIGQEPPLPATVILPIEPKSGGEFWHAIGGKLRPSLDYRVTISLDYDDTVTGPLVTTMEARYGEDGSRFTIGGTVTDDAVPPAVIAGAWVRVNETGEVSVTDRDGRFVFVRMAGGAYTATVRAVGFHEGNRGFQVPQPDGLYDIGLIPL